MTLKPEEAVRFLAPLSWTLDDVTIAENHARRRGKDPALHVGRLLGVDTGTATELIATAKAAKKKGGGP